MTPEERREFLESHRLCVVGTLRRDAPPQLSPVYYVLDGDDLRVSTTATRAKAKTVAATHASPSVSWARRLPSPTSRSTAAAASRTKAWSTL